jgi:hypothetical protein
MSVSRDLRHVTAAPARELCRSATRKSHMEIRPDPDGLDRLIVSAPEFDAEFEVYGNCPVQAFGTVLDREIYFRARHEDWSFDVADGAGNLPSDGYLGSDGFYRAGRYSNAGWMPLQEAVKIIVACLREFTGVET